MGERVFWRFERERGKEVARLVKWEGNKMFKCGKKKLGENFGQKKKSLDQIREVHQTTVICHMQSTQIYKWKLQWVTLDSDNRFNLYVV